MEIIHYKDLENIIKKDPVQITSILRDSTNYQRKNNIMKLTSNIGNNIIHLLSRYQPSYIYSVFVSGSFQPDIEANYLFFRKNIFGMNWLHVLCMYNIRYFSMIKEFVTSSLIGEQDMVGNTILHIIARFHPSFLKNIISHIFKNMNYNYLLTKRDILGNTFLHTLCIYHSDMYNEYINSFDNQIIQLQNYFGRICFDYIY